jgi:hypothetical protein
LFKILNKQKFGMREIVLNQGKVALVDHGDFEWLSQWKWYALKGANTWYAHRHVIKKGKGTMVSMHRALLGEPPNASVDHIDRNGLNNQRSNLRICSRAQNAYNAQKWSSNTSGFKGVSWRRSKRKWRAQIQAYGKGNKHLGYFDSPVDAAHAYDRAAMQYHGQFALLNFPIFAEPDLFDRPAA